MKAPSSTLAIEQLSHWAWRRGLLVDGNPVGDGAIFSPDRAHRYLLWRGATTSSAFMAFAMLNPSSAGRRHDDPTIVRCRRYAGVRGQPLLVWNLFTLVATDPAELARHPKPLGTHADDLVDLVLDLAEPTVAAWGANPAATDRAAQVLRRCAARDAPLHTLKLTSDGHPGHPLYLPAKLRPKPWAYSTCI